MIKILIIEDEKDWSDALKEVYQAIFSEEGCIITVRNAGYDAVRDITDGKKYDLLSLDLNLASTAIKDDTGTIVKNVPGFDGRSLISLAYKKKACKGIMVVSGIQEDDQYIWLDEQEGELHEFKRTIHQRLDELFPGKGTVFYKGKLADTISDIRRHEQIVKKIAGLYDDPKYGYTRIGQKWELIFGGKKLYFDDTNGFRYLYILIKEARKLDALYLYQFSKEKKREHYPGVLNGKNNSTSSEETVSQDSDKYDFTDQISISNRMEHKRVLNENVPGLWSQYDALLSRLDHNAHNLSSHEIELIQAEIVRIGKKILKIISKDDDRYIDILNDTTLYHDGLLEKIAQYERQIPDLDMKERESVVEIIKAIKTMLKNPEIDRRKNIIDSVRSGIKKALAIIHNEASKHSIPALSKHFENAFYGGVWEYKPAQDIPWRLRALETDSNSEFPNMDIQDDEQ